MNDSMSLTQLLHDLVFDYTLRTVTLGSIVLGLTSGVLGSFAVLRRQSLLGDAISHAALPGIAIAFLLTGAKSPMTLMVGAIVAGWIGTLVVLAVVRGTRIKEDAALGIVLSVFFGVGIVLLTFIQRMPTASQAGLDRYLFGQAATLLQRDVVTMALMGGLTLAVVFVLWKEFKLLSFDPEFAASTGVRTEPLNVLLTTLIVVAIVVGLQTVGVVLMSAMIVAPASAARQWTERLSVMVVLSGLFGAIAGLAGAVTSSLVPRLPTGPTIVLFVSAIVLVSVLFAPHRGVAAKARRRSRQRLQFAAEALVVHLLHHEGQPDEAQESTVEHLRAHVAWSESFSDKVVRWSKDNELLTQAGARLVLTQHGRETAQRVMVR